MTDTDYATRDQLNQLAAQVERLRVELNRTPVPKASNDAAFEGVMTQINRVNHGLSQLAEKVRGMEERQYNAGERWMNELMALSRRVDDVAALVDAMSEYDPAVDGPPEQAGQGDHAADANVKWQMNMTKRIEALEKWFSDRDARIDNLRNEMVDRMNTLATMDRLGDTARDVEAHLQRSFNQKLDALEARFAASIHDLHDAAGEAQDAAQDALPTHQDAYLISGKLRGQVIEALHAHGENVLAHQLRALATVTVLE